MAGKNVHLKVSDRAVTYMKKLASKYEKNGLQVSMSFLLTRLIKMGSENLSHHLDLDVPTKNTQAFNIRMNEDMSEEILRLKAKYGFLSWSMASFLAALVEFGMNLEEAKDKIPKVS